MKSVLDFRDGYLCVVELQESAQFGSRRLGQSSSEARPICPASEAEVKTLLGRPVRSVDQREGIYVDEEGNVYQLANKGETKPIAEHLPGQEKTELETLLEASLKNKKGHEPNGDSKRRDRKIRNDRPKPKIALQVASAVAESASPRAPASVEPSGATINGKAPETSLRLNLRQKLAEVRRRIGYVQKRGHNELCNYSYVTAADIAGAVGDLLAELGVVVIPWLEEITYESAAGRGEAIRMARVVMAYTFADVDSGEELVAKVAGQGHDPGDKAPYKAMTGALKYALLQSFLLATGDDPEDERPDARSTPAKTERPINAEEVRHLKMLIDETGTELERVLTYYKVASLEEMTEATYRRAIEVLNRKLAQRGNEETAHAQS